MLSMNSDSNSENLLWRPSEDRVARSQMFEFMRRAAAKYGFTPDYASMHRWSVTRCDQFWGEMFDYAGIGHSRPASSVASGSGMLGTKWFAGLEFNFAEHLLRFDDDRVAIEAEDELGRTRTITYRQLRAEVAALAGALRSAGLTRGDRVGAFMPNIPETVIAMLATASIGAIFSSCSPDFGIEGVIDRFGQIEPKVFFAADGYSYNGKTIDLLERVRGIAERIPSLAHVVVVPFIGTSPKLDGIRGAAIWPQFIGVNPNPERKRVGGKRRSIGTATVFTIESNLNVMPGRETTVSTQWTLITLGNTSSDSSTGNPLGDVPVEGSRTARTMIPTRPSTGICSSDSS